MKKLKFFISIFKERDWLEEMAQKGWLLQDITWGILYHFKESKPVQKVFEIERFGASNHPKIQEINARRLALDIAEQTGWQVVTHDEEMNYYFMKDKAGDETDEFYDEEEMRKERAERFKNRYGYEMPSAFAALIFIVTLLYMLLFAFFKIAGAERNIYLMGIYMVFVLMEAGIVFFYLWWANKIYDELNLSREQWELRKKAQKAKSFKKVKELREYLQEKEKEGFVLTAYENKKYLFEESQNRYDYCIDTKEALRKRLKRQGGELEKEKKDWQKQSLKWYEMSIREAETNNLSPVCVVGKNVLIYKRIHTEEPLPWENDNIKIGFLHTLPTLIVMLVEGLAIGFVAGFIAGMLLR